MRPSWPHDGDAPAASSMSWGIVVPQFYVVVATEHTRYAQLKARCSRRSLAQGLVAPPPPPWRHGTARHKTRRHTEIPTAPLYSYPARPYPERALRDDHYGVPVTYIWAQCICFLVSGPMLAFPGGPWVDIVASWWSLDGHWYFLVVF